MRKSAQGFTLIELIIVITIVGILAAVALPRYIAAQRDARTAKAQAIYGSVRAAAALAKARCVLDQSANPVGTCLAAGNSTVSMDGQSVNMVNSYPAATAAGILTAAQIDTVNDGVTVAGAAPLTITINGATAAANCRISYTAAPANGSPTIVLSATNC